MKKLFLLLFVMTACNNKNGDNMQSQYGTGGENACQFVKEQVPGLREDIAKIEVIGEDSLLGDLGLTFASIRAGDIKMGYYQGKVSYDEMSRVLDSCQTELMYVEQSWKYGNISKKQERFKYQWKKVYTVRVTMKSGVKKEPRVMMENDGITPLILEMDFFSKLDKYRTLFTY